MTNEKYLREAFKKTYPMREFEELRHYFKSRHANYDMVLEAIRLAREEKQQTIFYGFYYNGMTEESSYALMSLHRTKKAAEIAMEFHKKEKFEEFKKDQQHYIREYGVPGPYDEFGKFENWFIDEIEIKD